jgi:hypothetical protein
VARRYAFLGASLALGTILLGLIGREARADIFDLNIANVSFTGGPPYATVDVENPSPGEITFTLTDLTGSGSFVEFGFNTNQTITSANFTGLPGSWSVEGSKTLDGFGSFNWVVGSSSDNENPATITLTGLSSSVTTADFELNTSSGGTSSNNYFAAHLKQPNLTGFIGNNDGPQPQPPNNVPEPSTFVIAGLGALGFIGYALRHRSKV